jgi:hypothetical protein
MPVTANADHLAPLAINRSTLTKILRHAAFAAHLVGHLDDAGHPALVRELGEHVDAIAHELAELLGDPRVLVGADDFAADDRESHDGVPLLTASNGGTP